MVQAIQNFTDYSIFLDNMNNINKTKKNLYNTQRQIASGKIAQTHQELSALGLTEGTIDNQSRISTYDAYLKNNTVVLTKLEAIDISIANITSKLEEFKKVLTHKRSANSKYVDIKAIAKSSLAIIRENLNTKSQGKYIFAGSRTNIEPVTDIVSNTNIIKNQVSANYYSGDAIISQAKISDTVTIEYGVLASNTSFQQAIGTFHLGIEGHNNNEDSKIADAIDMCETALTNLIQLRAQVRDKINQIRYTKDNIEVTQRYYSDKLAETTSTQIEDAAIKLSQERLILEGTFQTYGKLSGLSLMNHLK